MKYLEKLLRPQSIEAFDFDPKLFQNSKAKKILEQAKSEYPSLCITLGDDVKVDSVYRTERREFATAYFIIDVSASVCRETKEHFAGIQQGVMASLNEEYEGIRSLVVPHTTKALDVTPGLDWIESVGLNWMTIAETGGTIVSSGYKRVSENIMAGPAADDRDYYIVQLTDGDNWADDTKNVDREIQSLALDGEVAGFKYFEVSNRPQQGLGKMMESNLAVESYRMRVGSPTIIS